MRKNLVRVLTTAAVTGFLLFGCKASVKMGGGETPPPPPPPPPKEEPPPPPPPKIEPKKSDFNVSGEGKLAIPGPVEFETGSDKLLPASDPVLEHVRKYLDQNPQISKMRVEGHTDSQGDDASNMDLSKRRSMSVVRWLVGKGVDCKRLVAVGFGETRPVADNNTDEGRAQNRRTAFYNAAVNGKPIRGRPIDGGGTSAGDPCGQ